LVIHIGKPFGSALAEWLNGQSPIQVIEAEDGMPLPRGSEPRVIIAPPDLHLVLEHRLLRLTADPERHSCRPSVDILFESVARETGRETIACLLTGMGKDGAAGTLAIRRAGGLTLVQDEASSIVFGMPREAIQLGAADRILALDEFAPALESFARRGPPEVTKS
jgi:two-component system chemotaxis response regulator CheB